MTETPPSPTDTTTDFEEVLSQPAINAHDRVPGWVMRAYGLLGGVSTYRQRMIIAVVMVALGLAGVFLVEVMRPVRTILDVLDVVSFFGLFIVNWVGNGGVLVPVPGARFLGLLMIFQHAVIYPSWEVLAVSGTAMALGLVSYYVAGTRTANAFSQGDTAAARDVLTDVTILARSQPGTSRRSRLTRRFSESWAKAQSKARPMIDEHGVAGMFWLCFVPLPTATAGAFLGGAMRFGFTRFLLAAFASKYLLAGIIVGAGLILSDQARSVVSPF